MNYLLTEFTAHIYPYLVHISYILLFLLCHIQLQFLQEVSGIPEMPFIIMGILGVISGTLIMFLPETAKVKLPETIEEGELFGTDQNFFYMPMFNSVTRMNK